MKILYLHQYFATPNSSSGTRSYDLAMLYKNHGHKVTIVTSSSLLNFPDLNEGWTIKHYQGLELHILKLAYSNKTSFTKRISVFLKFLIAASRRVLKIKCDIVIATSTPLTIAIPALVKKAINKTPFIFEVRDVWPEVPIAMGIIKGKIGIKFLNFFERYVYKKAVHVVPLSSDMAHSIVSRTGLPLAKITIIPNIAELTRFGNIDANANVLEKLLGFKPQKTVLYAGTLGMVNGLTYMAELARCTYKIDKDIRYVIVGDGMEKENIIKYAADNNILNKNIFFLDPVSKSQLPQIYFECTVATSFVIPVTALWANSANKLFDSLAAGKPAVINHLGWQADLIKTEDCGFVFDYDIKNIRAEAERFCAYMNNDELIAEQGQRAKQIAKEQFSLEIAGAKFLNIFDNVIS